MMLDYVIKKAVGLNPTAFLSSADYLAKTSFWLLLPILVMRE